MAPERIEAHYGGPRGPLNSYYHKMVLSNPVVDERGWPWAIVHNLLAGDAQLFRHEEQRALGRHAVGRAGAHAAAGLPHPALRPVVAASGWNVEAVLMVSPEAEAGWGEKSTTWSAWSSMRGGE